MKFKLREFVRIFAALCPALFLNGCTKQTDQSFRFLQVVDAYQGAIEVNNKVDLLWVVDNSASMDVSQDRLRRDFQTFADKYLKPSWDIRMAVITTDTYMADRAFSAYLQTVIPGTDNWVSPYISSRLETVGNPSWNPNLLNLKTGAFTKGITWGDQVHAWGGNYAKLLPGIHDGPIATLCSEAHSNFFLGASQCFIRDDQTRYSGPSHCLNPAQGETAITQCVNTVQNDTVHSGRAILSTQPPAGVPADAAWISQISRDFMINSSTGSSGSGSERGFASVLQLLRDNEPSSTALFRKGSARVIVFLSDEDDQTLIIPSTPSSGFGPFSFYLSNCSSKNVDGYSYTLSSCPDPTRLVPVSSVKAALDQFFLGLDGNQDNNPNYLIVPIVALSGASIQKLQQERKSDDLAVGTVNTAVDRGDRYLALAELVGEGSFAGDIGNEDYSTVLDKIGRAMVQQKSQFTLSQAPDSLQDLQLTIARSDGSLESVPVGSYSVADAILTITDLDLVLSLASNDRILISYIPRTIN
ncbi:MAG TPA: hypothetical protein DCS07_06685 [Bdellovibrionales bacterium]|nr:MAG: hypothetical protein A2070_05910 [Bdellovibrionales bacterium GWC1_52_8]HAR42304.1 hypothetical protein [Bdellovibrionales bacterium]